MQSGTISRMRSHAPAVLVLLGLLVACGAYLQALHFPFLSDDDTYITHNDKLAGLQLSGLWRLLVEPFNTFEFLPLRDLSYWLDIQWFGLNAAAFRLHNMLLYSLCCLLVYVVTVNIWTLLCPDKARDARWAAAAVATLFAIHPAHVEAVVWVSGRKDVLSGLFALLALWLALKVRRGNAFAATVAAATLLALLAAMLSKATAVVMAPVIAMLWIIFWRGLPASSRPWLTLIWPLAGVLLAAGFVLIFSAHSTVKVAAYWGVETITRAFAIIGWLVRLAVSPGSRHYFYPVFEDSWLYGMVALGAVVTLAASAMVLLRQRNIAGFCLPVFVLLCLPYAQLLPFTTTSLVSERFLFLAVWPVLLLLVWVVWRLNPAARTLALFVIAVPWIYQTVERTKDWRSIETFVTSDLRAFPGHYEPAAEYILAFQGPRGLMREAVETADSITQPEIRKLLLDLIEIDNAVHDASISSGNLNAIVIKLWNLGEDIFKVPVEADWNLPMGHPYSEVSKVLDREWMILARKFPDDLSVRHNAGLWQLNAGKYENAAINFRAEAASRQLPEAMRGSALRNLGVALLRAGQVAQAEAPLRAALAQAQLDRDANCALLEVLQRSGRAGESGQFAAACRQQVPQ